MKRLRAWLTDLVGGEALRKERADLAWQFSRNMRTIEMLQEERKKANVEIQQLKECRKVLIHQRDHFQDMVHRLK